MIKYFIITLDTEGDNAWDRRSITTVENAKYLPRFQKLCDKYSFKPTYLTNYEMAQSKDFIELGKSIISENRGEIGMHLHAWDSPPEHSLTDKDWHYHPYLLEYPPDVIIKKIEYMTTLLQDTFDVKMSSHRAGRWAFNENYAKLLIDFGYKVDCSVTPGISWEFNKGDPQKNGGSDYRKFPLEAYFINLNNIAEKGDSALLEVPMTIIPMKKLYEKKSYFINIIKNNIKVYGNINKIFKKDISAALERIFPDNIWLRPDGTNLKSMLDIVNKTSPNNVEYLEFMLHTSELMPGGSNRFKTVDSIENLYKDLDKLFYTISKSFKGVTLKEYYDIKSSLIK